MRDPVAAAAKKGKDLVVLVYPGAQLSGGYSVRITSTGRRETHSLEHLVVPYAGEGPGPGEGVAAAMARPSPAASLTTPGIGLEAVVFEKR